MRPSLCQVAPRYALGSFRDSCRFPPSLAPAQFLFDLTQQVSFLINSRAVPTFFTQLYLFFTTPFDALLQVFGCFFHLLSRPIVRNMVRQFPVNLTSGVKERERDRYEIV